MIRGVVIERNIIGHMISARLGAFGAERGRGGVCAEVAGAFGAVSVKRGGGGSAIAGASATSAFHDRSARTSACARTRRGATTRRAGTFPFHATMLGEAAALNARRRRAGNRRRAGEVGRFFDYELARSAGFNRRGFAGGARAMIRYNASRQFKGAGVVRRERRQRDGDEEKK